MAHFKLIGPGPDGLYEYGGASIELSNVGTTRWWATVRFKSQEIDFEARSSEEALEKAMEWVDAAPEHPRDFYGKPRPLGEARRPGSKPKYRPSKARKNLKVARVVPSHGAWSVEFEDNFSIQVHGGSGRSDLLYAMKPLDMSYEGRSPGPETRRDYQYLALKAVLGDRSADFVIDHDGDVMAYLKDAGAVSEARRSKITTVTYSMPIYWASYLINGDASGIDDDDIAQADAAIEDIGLGAPVDVGESEFRSRGDYGSLGGDYADYTFIDHSGTREARAPRPQFKLGAPRPGTSVRDYEAVDNRNRHIAGPFKHYSDAKNAAGPGGHVKYVRPGARAEAKRGGDEARGREYATEQVQSEHFNNWIWDQMVEAEELRKSDPSQVLPLDSDADFRRVAKGMLQQLKWDAAREMRGESEEFTEGFRDELESEHMVDWLVDELKSIDEQMKGPRHEQLPLPHVRAKKAKRSKPKKKSARRKRR